MNSGALLLLKISSVGLLLVIGSFAHATEVDFYVPTNLQGKATKDVLTALESWEAAVEHYQSNEHPIDVSAYQDGKEAIFEQLSRIRARARNLVDLAQSYRDLREGIDQLMDEVKQVATRAKPSSPAWRAQVNGTKAMLDVLRNELSENSALSLAILIFTTSQLLAGEEDKAHIRFAANDVQSQLYLADEKLAKYRSLLKQDSANIRSELALVSE